MSWTRAGWRASPAFEAGGVRYAERGPAASRQCSAPTDVQVGCAG